MTHVTEADRVAGSRRAHDGYVAAPGARLYFRDVGAGSPLVILHGGPDFDHAYLLPELDRLSNAFRLIYYDQRGRGKSSGNISPDAVDIESEVEDLDRVRQYFGLDTISILGHSWGALLAMEYATRHAENVSRVVLLNTAPASHADFLSFRKQREVAEAPGLAKMRAIAETPAYGRGDMHADAEYYRAHFSQALRRPDLLEEVVQRLRLHFTPADILKARAIEDRLCAETWMSPAYDLLPRLQALKMPTLVIHGDHDSIPLDCARHIAEAIPGARMVVLDDCGHFAYLERPDEVHDTIVDFFTAH